jgi:hypothetical protein
LHLAALFRGQVILAPGETWHEVEYGCIALACRRASRFGRAPVKDDVELALLVWGFFQEGIDPAVLDRLVALRRPLFADVAHNDVNHRRIADSVPEDVLGLSPAEARARMAQGDILVSAPTIGGR